MIQATETKDKLIHLGDLFFTEEAAKHLKISMRALFLHLRNGTAPKSVLLGKKRVFIREELDAWGATRRPVKRGPKRKS